MNTNVIGVGEVLWDLLLTGPQLGGAPANFAYHAHALGAQAQVITRVGNDDYGREIIRRFTYDVLPEDGFSLSAWLCLFVLRLHDGAPTHLGENVGSGDEGRAAGANSETIGHRIGDEH